VAIRDTTKGKTAAPPMPKRVFSARTVGKGRWVGLAVFIFLFLGSIVAWQRSAAITQAVHAWLVAPFAQQFVLEDVYLTGQHHTTNQEIVSALDIRIGTPLFLLDLPLLRNRLLQLPWVADADVRRILPDILAIHLQERTPVALWQYKEKLRLLDSEGNDFSPPNLKPFLGYILLVGEDAPSHLPELQSLLKEAPALAPHVKTAIRVSSRRWNIRFDNGTEVKLPEIAPEKAMQQLLALHTKNSLWKSTIRSIDMRVPGKTFVK